MPSALPPDRPAPVPPPCPGRGATAPAGERQPARGTRPRHGLRAEAFGLLPEEDPAAFAALAAEVHRTYAAEDAVERELVDGILVAMWTERRADRLEAGLLADGPRAAPDRGADLAGDPDGRAALATLLRYRTVGQNALRRGVELLLKHRTARRKGLLLEPAAADSARAPLPTAPQGPPSRRVVARPIEAASEAPVGRPTSTEDDAPAPTPLPPVEADPSREARRLELLARVTPVLRPGLARTGLDLLEHHLAASDPDPTVYEAWFAAQAKLPAAPMPLAPEDEAAIRHVTRHNPPWLKGAYLGYHRPPVPKAAFAANQDGVPATQAVPEPAPEPTAAAAAAPPVLDLAARVARLLDRGLPRRPEELDLAEAICALRWPSWPAYTGPIDPAALRRALAGVTLDPDTLHWLGSPELARACHAAAVAQRPQR